MGDPVFPLKPADLLLRPTPVELVVRRRPLSAIQEVLSISVHDLVNDARVKHLVADFYRISCRLQNERWLRRELQQLHAEALPD